MGFKNRELEKKFTVTNGWHYNAVVKKIEDVLKKQIKRVIVDDSTDIYFHTPKTMKVDFCRVRFMPGGKAQLTVKHTDKGNNTNRVEIDVDIDDPAQAIAICTQIFGLPARSVRKKYNVFFLDKQDSNASVYQINGDKRIFVEIEARTLKKVDRVIKKLKKYLELEYESKSIYQLFVKGKK